MSQNDMSIANQTFPATRSDINGALQAGATLQSGASAPSTTYAYMFWADTTNGVLKQRNSGDSGWVIRDTLSDDRVVSKTSAYTILLGDMNKTILASASGGAFTITLLAAATAGDGFEVTIKKADSSNNTVTIDANGSETIDGELDFTLLPEHESVTLRSDGSNWVITSYSGAYGTFTPEFNSTGATFGTYGDQFGYYFKNRNQYTISMEVALGAAPTGTLTNALQITGIPSALAIILQSGFRIGVACKWSDINITSGTDIRLDMSSNSATLQVWYVGDNLTSGQIAPSTMGSAAAIEASFTYIGNP